MDDIDNQLGRIDKLLDEYERNLGLPDKSKYEDSAAQYFNMTRTQLEALSAEDCAHGSYILSNLALHIQRTLNRETSRCNWIHRNIKFLVADKASQYRGSWEQQETQALKDDSVGKKLFILLTENTTRIDRLNYIATNVRQLAEALTNIQKAKIGTRHG
jgi:hypothetical protein